MGLVISQLSTKYWLFYIIPKKLILFLFLQNDYIGIIPKIFVSFLDNAVIVCIIYGNFDSKLLN